VLESTLTFVRPDDCAINVGAVCRAAPMGATLRCGGGGLLAAIGICPLAAVSGRPETANFVTDRNQGSWRGLTGNRLVRSGLAATRSAPDPTRMGKSVLARVSSPFTGFGDVRVFIDGHSNKSVDRDSVHDADALHRLGCVIPPRMTQRRCDPSRTIGRPRTLNRGPTSGILVGRSRIREAELPAAHQKITCSRPSVSVQARSGPARHWRVVPPA